MKSWGLAGVFHPQHPGHLHKPAVIGVLFSEELGKGSGNHHEPGAVGERPEGTSSSEAAPAPQVDNAGAFAAPENHGVDAQMPASLHRVLADTQVHAAATVRNGVIIDEYYGEGYDETSVFPPHSASKSFTGALVGIAIDEGLISGVDAKQADYLPQAIGTDKADVTLELDLVTVMTSTHKDNTYLPRNHFRDYILPACTPSEAGE